MPLVDATPDDLHAALGPVAAVSRRPHPYQTSHPLEELDVELATGERLELLAKDLRGSALLPAAVAAKPASLVDDRRELEVYRRILARRQLDAPRFYGSVGSVLLIERVAGTVLWQVGDRAVWDAVARRLAHLHATTAGVDNFPAEVPLLCYDAGVYRTTLERACAAAPDLAPLAAGYDTVVDELTELRRSLLHGECYPSNVLVDATSDPPRVVFVDWEMAAVGPGLLDLAALCTGSDGEARQGLVDAYRRERPDELSDEAFERALDACRLHVALQWIGWAPAWSPPAEHAYDWHGEAHELWRRLR